jgi:putative two-component system response regulator
VRTIHLAAPLHDVGKIGVPDEILFKPGRLTSDERARMQLHTEHGEDILGGSNWTLLKVAAAIAAGHHERWDGAGYPRGLAGEDIPLPSRIVAVADVFDALVSPRSYKQPWSLEEARRYLMEERGHHFDPACVDAFLARWDEVVAIGAGACDAAVPVALARHEARPVAPAPL